MKKEVKKCAALIGAVSMLGTTLYALPANAAESTVRDFRVTDVYTGLSYGSVNSEVLQYTGTDSGVVLSDNGAEINTENDFSLKTREDILDGLAAAANGRAVEFTMTAGVQSCESLALTVTDGTRETTLYQADAVQGENEFSVIYTGKSAMLTVNDTVIHSVACSSVPVVTLSGTDADMTISDVNYSVMAASEETEEEAVILADMNAAADSDAMETALTAYLEHAGKASVYTSLPDCDTVNIKERLLAAKPFSTYADVVSGYQSALEAATRVDTSVYNQVFVEDFNGGADESWTATNLASNAIGNGKVLGNVRQGLEITDEQYSFAAFGGSLQTKKANYIEREIANPQSIVTLYMRVINNNALSFSVTFDGSNGIGLKNTGTDCHTIVNNDAKSKTSASFTTDKWNKIVLDGTESGKVKCYVNGSLAASFNSTMTKLTVGTIFNFGSYSILEIDNISIGEAKPESDFMDRFNNSQVTEESLAGVLGGTAGGVFQKLPECDRTELVKIIEAGKPYTDKTAIRNQYDKALIKVTQYDSDKYGLYFSEDFGNGITSDWESAKKPAIGSFLSNTVDDLNIGGTETKSAIFWGASVKASNGEESVTGDNQSIRRAVPKNSRISLYFWDSRNDNSAFLGIKVNDNLIAGAYGNTDKYVYTKNGGSGWSATSVAKSYGWHKLVFDGAAEAGKITLYLDGESIETVSGDTEYLEIGNLWAVAGFAYFAVDNITVSREFIPAVSNLRVMDHKTSLEIAYDYSHTGNKAEGKTKFQWYRKNDSGTFEKIDNATEQIYTYKFPDDMGKTFRVEVTPVDVNGVIGDTVTSTEFTESYMNSIKPTVSAASIVGNVYAGAELRAQYTATGGTDASKDQYQWYVSENGSEWKAIAGATGSVYTAGTEIIGKQLKFTVSVAGAEGSYSDWFECQPVRDTTTLIQMITAVKSKSSMGRNQEMLDFLKLLDSAFSGYSVGHQQKIVLKLFDTAVSTEAEYQALVSKILQEDDDVPDSDLFGIDKNHGIIVDGSTGTGGTEYRKFTDIDSVEWAKEAIYALTNQQILSGKGERLFCPNDNITRAEFVTLLVRAFFGNETSTKKVFTDVSEDAWYAPQIAAAYAKGLVSGKGDGTFGPNEAITREEMAVLCARVEALGVCDAGEEREYSAFADENDISEYAYDSVVAMYQKGFINGVGENRFHAKGYTTRAMAAVLIYKMMKKENRLDATGNTVSEDFEVWPGIFKPGNPQDSSIGEATDGEFSYSGTGSLKIIGKNEAYTAAGSNRAFRVMIYDDADKTSITAMMSVGSYRLGLNTSGKSRVENYAYAVGNTWTDAGVTRTTGWHEFIIDMSRVGFVDLYIDGNKVAELEAKDENPEYVLIGNEWHNSTSAAYADEFRMARTLEELREIKGRGYSNGNELIEETEMSVENLPESIREAAGLLYTLKILAVENGADVDRKITKEEFLYLVCGMMNQSAAAKKATKAYFSDVAANSRYAGYVQYAVEQGLIDGNEDRLGAQDAVSGAFGARLMMTLLGYGKAGSNQDESWWLQKATQIGLFKGLQSTFGELSLSDAIMLCYNTLLTDVFQVEGLEKNQPEYSESNGVTLLNYRFDVYSGEDYLNGVYGAELSETKTLSKNEALIGNTVVNSYDSNLARYNGMKIRAYLYAPEANDKTLIYAFNRKKNTELTISAHDLVSVDGKKLNYTDQSKIKNAKLTTDLKVVYNGSYLFGYTTENLIPEIGYVRLVDRDADGSYDIAFVMEYKPIKVQGLDIDKKLVYDEYEDTAYDFGDTEFITTGLYQHFALESLQKDQFILMAVSQDGKRVDILADGTEIEGSVDRLQDEYISIDGTEYYRVVSLDSYYKRKGLQGITVGMTGTFTVDAFGNIIGTSSVASSSRHFGYLIHAWQDDNEGRYHIKLYADTGKIEEYEFAEQITYNGSKTKNPDAVLSLSPQLVRFKISSEGVLNVLETADTENQNSDSLKGSDSFWLFRDADVWYRDNGYQFGLALRIAKDTPVMFVPNAENIKNEKKYSIGSYASFSNGQTFHYKAYNADEYNFPEIIVVEAVSTGKLKNGNESPLFVVKSITEEIDEDNQTVNMLNGYESGVLTSYPIAEDVDLDAVKQGYGYTNDIEAGDTFMTYFNPNGEISDLKYITHMQEASDQYNDLSSWNFVFDNISCCYAKVDSMGKALRITDGIHQSVIGTPQRVYVYSQALKTLTTGTTADLISGREIAIRTCHGNTREVIVYVD